MDARARFYALAVSAALVMAAGAMGSNDAMAQADDVAVQDDVAPVETTEETVQDDVAPVETTEAAAPDDDVAAQDEAVERPIPKQKPAAVERTAKSNLDQSEVRAAPVIRPPRATRTSTRAIAVPKILGVYR